MSDNELLFATPSFFPFVDSKMSQAILILICLPYVLLAADLECKESKTCSKCNGLLKCAWDAGNRACVPKNTWCWDKIAEKDQCPCEKCKTWHDSEQNDRAWLDKLNKQFLCPCKVDIGNSWLGLKPINNNSSVPQADWVMDLSCLQYGLPMCSKFHPGAYGCIRSAKITEEGARQQCCYDESGNILQAGLPGAGTPDKASSFFAHQKLDVDPYNWCCRECEIKEYCRYYIGDMRLGNTQHCK